MRQISTLLLLSLFAALPLSLKATHIVGGEMTYKCLGNNQYEIKLTIFRDCFYGVPWFDNPASIGIFDNTTNLPVVPLIHQLVPLDPMLNDTLDPTLDNDCLAVPPNVCVHTTTYTRIINLPFRQNGYHLVYQRCCRNNTIANLIAPEDVGATYSVVISPEAQLACNSSPVFNQWPPLYLCANVPFEIDQSAQDIDGDSLVYKLCNPLTGASDINPMPQPPNAPPYNIVPWLPPYGVNNMINLPPAPPMVIDQATGLLTGTPNILGQFVIGICVEEYRNGQLIGVNRRDYQVNIGDCQAIVANAADPGVICGSRTVSFSNQSINAVNYRWLFNDPGNPGATSTAVNPTYTFSNFGEYEVLLIAEPGADCADSAFIQVSVQPNSVTVDFDVEVVPCLGNVLLQVTDLSTDTFSTITDWEWALQIGGNTFTSNEQHPSFVVTPPGGAVISLTVTNAVGCKETFEDIFPVKPSLLDLDLGPDVSVCQFSPFELDAGPGFDAYLWYDFSTSQTITVNAPGLYSVTATDACGETVVDQVLVEIGTLTVDAGPDQDICFPGQTVTLNGSVAGPFVNVQWEPSAGMSDPNSLNTQVFVSTTTTFKLTAVSNATDNLIVNGSFEAGASGFNSDYVPGTGGSFGLLSLEGQYAVATNASLTHVNFAACNDHSGSGNLLVVNGAPVPNENIWCQTVAVAPGSDYQFSAWMTSVHPESPAILQFSINGDLLGSPFGLSGVTCDWENFFENWASGTNTSAEICIVNQNTSVSGNDFAIDDLFFGPVCSASDEVTIVVLPAPQTNESVEICEGETILVFGNPVNTAGDYSQTFTTSEGCDSVHTITVAVKPSFSTTENVGICEGETAVVFGNTVGTAGVFSQTYTAQNGCDSVHTITVAVYPNYHIIEDAQICEGETVVIFGNPISTPGEFSDTLQTVNGCDSIHTINLAVLPNAFTSESITVCFGETVDIFGTQTGVAGIYEQTFPAVNGCDSTHTITLSVYDEITIETVAFGASCFGLADGSAVATASGGTGNFSYSWSNGSMLQEANDLTAGSYTVTATDASGCEATATVTIDQPTQVQATATGVNVNCTTLGSASASATGGTGNYTFVWSTGATGASISGLVAGVYSVTTSDQNNCTATTTVTITGALAPTIAANVVQQLTIDEPNSGKLSVSIAGGTMPYNILWSNGSTTAMVSDLSSGQYIVQVTDAQGCVVRDTAYLYVPACMGGKIWKDTNRNGCQEGGEFGFGGVEMTFTGTDIWGNAITGTTTSAVNGEYIFEGLPPGSYLISMEVPDDYDLSPANACSDDFIDSDFNASGVATQLVVLVEGHCCLIIDGGIYDDCLNVYDPGAICCDQYLCGPGNLAAPITSVSPAVGANQVQYQWIYSEVSPDNPNSGTWNQVKDLFGNPVTTLSLNPGVVYVTTHYARCVRAVGCGEWLVTDVVTVTVGTEAIAKINKPGPICVGEPIKFTAAANGTGASYLWNFGPTATPPFTNAIAPTVVFNSPGYPTVWLTVTNNGCTSTDRMLIAVSNDPVYCGTAIGGPGNPGQQPGIAVNVYDLAQFRVFPNPVEDELTVEWTHEAKTKVTLEILGTDGRLLVSEKAVENTFSHRLGMGYLNPGLYLLRLRHSDGQQEVFKLVKQ